VLVREDLGVHASGQLVWDVTWVTMKIILE